MDHDSKPAAGAPTKKWSYKNQSIPGYGAVVRCGGAVRWCGAVVQCWLHRTAPPHHRTAPPHQTTVPAPTYAPNNRTKLAAEIPEIAADSAAISGISAANLVRLFVAVFFWYGFSVRLFGAVVRCGAVVRWHGTIEAAEWGDSARLSLYRGIVFLQQQKRKTTSTVNKIGRYSSGIRRYSANPLQPLAYLKPFCFCCRLYNEWD